VGTVGLELVAPIALNADKSQSLTPRLAIAYQVDALAGDSVNKSLNASLPSSSSSGSITSVGENKGTNAVEIAGSLEWKFAKQASFYASANYEAYSTGSQYGYGGGIKYSF
jgi:hypothetical protein